MANLGNTIVNGILRVNGKVNSSDVISAPSFTGALTGNADTATKLKTARTINGTSFDGSGNITTANWGTARNIGIVNSDGTGTAVTVSVNGSGNINLKLPATIKAALTGNAATATKLATARTINGVSFDGSANITVADSTKLPLTGGTLSGDLNFSHAGSGNPASIGWNTGTIRQRIRIFDEGATDNNVFEFQQSRDSGGTYATLMVITANNKVKATTFVGALSGNATSATNATNTGTTNTNPTSGTWYYPTWVTGTSGNLPHRVNNGYQYYTLEGTTSAAGRAILQLGNAIATGTAGNKYGEVRIYNQNKGYTTILGTSSASNFTITLPAASGTVSLTSHTHSAATTSANGFMSSADKTKLNALHYVRSGTAVPDSSLGENGDIYILLES